MRGASLPLVGALLAHLLRQRQWAPPIGHSDSSDSAYLARCRERQPARRATRACPRLRCLPNRGLSNWPARRSYFLFLKTPRVKRRSALVTSSGSPSTTPPDAPMRPPTSRIRRERVVKAYRERFASEPEDSRRLDVVDGDVAVLCVSTTSDHWASAMAIALEIMKPVTVTVASWMSISEKWRNHAGLAAVLDDNPLRRQLQALTWLGNSEATLSIQDSVQPSLALRPEDVVRAAASKPQRFVVTVAGQYDATKVEQWMRRQAPSLFKPGREPQPPAPIAQPTRQNPRFAHERIPHSEGHVWLFSWPISHLDESYASSLELVAQLIERRLNRTSILDKAGTASCELLVGRGFGSLVVEIRSPVLLELDRVEKWVFSAIEQLGYGPIDRNELAQAKEQATYRTMPPESSPIDRAWTTTQRRLRLRNASRAPKTPTATQPEILRLIERDLNRRSVAEIFGEAAPAASQARGRGTARARERASTPRGDRKLTNLRGGRIYVVQNGESLQMIANKFHVTIPELIRANGLRHPDQIRPGARIVVPAASSSAARK